MHELLKKVADPKQYGQIWVILHKRALAAQTQAEKDEFERFLVWTVSTLLCEECRKDGLDYLKKNPIKPWANTIDQKTGARVGLFKYTWIFHNFVNRKLGKKELDFMTCLAMYSDNSVGCTDCHADKNEKNEKKKDEKDEKNAKIKIVGKY
jgi:hypothetical protein